MVENGRLEFSTLGKWSAFGLKDWWKRLSGSCGCPRQQAANRLLGNYLSPSGPTLPLCKENRISNFLDLRKEVRESERHTEQKGSFRVWNPKETMSRVREGQGWWTREQESWKPHLCYRGTFSCAFWEQSPQRGAGKASSAPLAFKRDRVMRAVSTLPQTCHQWFFGYMVNSLILTHSLISWGVPWL